MKSYVNKQVQMCYVAATDIMPLGTPITIRTMEGDVDMAVDQDLIIMIGVKGEVHPNRRQNFERSYEVTDEPYCTDETHSHRNMVYRPTIRNRQTGEVMQLIDYAKVCITRGITYIHAKELTKRVKVFTVWDEEKYMLGKPGDFLAVRCEDKHDIYVVERDIFSKTYDEIDIHRHDSSPTQTLI